MNNKDIILRIEERDGQSVVRIYGITRQQAERSEAMQRTIAGLIDTLIDKNVTYRLGWTVPSDPPRVYDEDLDKSI